MFMWKAYNTSQTDFLNSEFQNKYYFVGGKTNEISTYLNSILKLVFQIPSYFLSFGIAKKNISFLLLDLLSN